MNILVRIAARKNEEPAYIYIPFFYGPVRFRYCLEFAGKKEASKLQKRQPILSGIQAYFFGISPGLRRAMGHLRPAVAMSGARYSLGRAPASRVPRDRVSTLIASNAG